MTTTALEIIDTAVKIGLGATIGGLATYLVTRESHRQESRNTTGAETWSSVQRVAPELGRSECFPVRSKVDRREPYPNVSRRCMVGSTMYRVRREDGNTKSRAKQGMM